MLFFILVPTQMISSKHSNNRRSIMHTSILSLSLVSLTSAFVVPGTQSIKAEGSSGNLEQQHVSSSRKSINYGPNVKSIHHSISKPSIELELFNTASKFGIITKSSADCANLATSETMTKCIGTSVAQEFLQALHPTSSFKLIDSYVTKNTLTTHLHYLQLNSQDGIPIANGNVNINVGVNGNIISYGDSSYAGSKKVVSKKSTDGGDFRKKVASWATEKAQIVLGKARIDNGPQDQDVPSEYSTPPLIMESASYQTDPRHGLLSFLTLQAPSAALTEFLISSSRTDLINSFEIVEHETGKHSHSILNVPTTMAPVKASLAYVHDGKDLQLTWKYEVLTNDNQVSLMSLHDVSL